MAHDLECALMHDANRNEAKAEKDAELKASIMRNVTATMPMELATASMTDDKKKFLEAIRGHCRAQNAHKTPQGLDRQSGRFHNQRIIGVTLSRIDEDSVNEFLSDDEDAAFLHEITGTGELGFDYAIVEALREVSQHAR